MPWAVNVVEWRGNRLEKPGLDIVDPLPIDDVKKPNCGIHDAIRNGFDSRLNL